MRKSRLFKVITLAYIVIVIAANESQMLILHAMILSMLTPHFYISDDEENFLTIAQIKKALFGSRFS